jgi:molybdenum cofactor cytidylyltransferase
LAKLSTAGLVLAAGISRRFGASDKLMADLGGRPLLSYALQRLAAAKVDSRFVVVSSSEASEQTLGFGCSPIHVKAGCPISLSLQAGISGLPEGCDQVLLMLGDMPFVSGRTVDRLLEWRSPCCVSFEGALMPPALLPSFWFERIQSLTGDRGASALLSDIPRDRRLELSAEEIRDIDTVADLGAARRMQ